METTTTTSFIRLSSPSHSANSNRARPKLIQKSGQNSLRSTKRDIMSQAPSSQSRKSPSSRNHQDLESQFRQAYSCPVSDLTGRFQTSTSLDRNDNDVAAYVLQPDGTMATVRWGDKSALEMNAQVMTVLKEEQVAQRHGRTTGLIQNTSNPRSKLSPDMLNWLASDSSGASSPRTHSVSSMSSKNPSSHPQSPINSDYIIRRDAYSTNSKPFSRSPSREEDAEKFVKRRLTQTRSMPSRATPPRASPPKVTPTSTYSDRKPPQNSKYSTNQQKELTRQHKLNLSCTDGKAVSPNSTSSSQVQTSYWQPTTSPTHMRQSSEAPTSPSSQVTISNYMSPPALSDSRYNFPQYAPVSRSVRFDCGNQYAPHGDPPESVWDYFRFYERCATSDL